MNTINWAKDGQARIDLRAVLDTPILQAAIATVKAGATPRVPQVVALPGNAGADITTQVAMLHLHSSGIFSAFEKLEALTEARPEVASDLPPAWEHVRERILAERKGGAPKKRKNS